MLSPLTPVSRKTRRSWSIWVEGPTDRIYLQQWIKLPRSNLEEGVDYSIMFYGGRLLSHLTPDDEEESAFPSLGRRQRRLQAFLKKNRRRS
jgi:hypothetical protein